MVASALAKCLVGDGREDPDRGRPVGKPAFSAYPHCMHGKVEAPKGCPKLKGATL